jgi:glycolate oxidase iron-sulfur subunit
VERFVRWAALRLSPRVARLLRYLPRLSRAGAWAESYPALGEVRGEVILFLGCIARDVDRETLEATLRVLRRFGYTVRVPRAQGCCGAIHLHAGDEAEGLALAERNLRAFAAWPGVPVVVAATGCAAQLVEYAGLPGLPARLRPIAQEFSARVVEVCNLLARAPWPAGVTLAPLAARVAVHEPCSLRNVLKGSHAPYAVLGLIPALEPLPLPGNGTCCGSAGAYMLTHPETADRLLEAKLDAVRTTAAPVVATTNPGCALHLGAGLAAEGSQVEVLHPLVLLDRQIRAGTP